MPSNIAEWLWVALTLAGAGLVFYYKDKERSNNKRLEIFEERIKDLEDQPEKPCISQGKEIVRLEGEVDRMRKDITTLQIQHATINTLMQQVQVVLAKIEEALPKLVTKEDLTRWFPHSN